MYISEESMEGVEEDEEEEDVGLAAFRTSIAGAVLDRWIGEEVEVEEDE